MTEYRRMFFILITVAIGSWAGWTAYAINRSISDIQFLAGNLDAYFAADRDLYGLDDSVVRAARLGPPNMFTDQFTSHWRMVDEWGGAVDVSAGQRSFQIALEDVPYIPCLAMAKVLSPDDDSLTVNDQTVQPDLSDLDASCKIGSNSMAFGFDL